MLRITANQTFCQTNQTNDKIGLDYGAAPVFSRFFVSSYNIFVIGCHLHSAFAIHACVFFIAAFSVEVLEELQRYTRL